MLRHLRPGMARLAIPLLALLVGMILAPAHPVAAAANITLSRSTAAQNDIITVNGYGFHPGDTAVVTTTLPVHNSPLQVEAVAAVGSNGNFSTSFRIPAGTASGTYITEARDFSGNVASHELIVLPLAYLGVGGGAPTVYVVADHQFYVSGAGFAAGEDVRISATFPLYNGNSVVVTRTVHTSAQGRFYELLLQVPNGARSGTTVLTAKGLSSGRSARANINVVYRPTITATPAIARPGATVTVSGQGYVPGSTINVSMNVARNGAPATTVTTSTTANGDGGFTAQLVVPANARVGTYTVTATDSQHGFRSSDRVRVAVHPSISLKPGSGFPGEIITVTGGGYGLRVPVTVTATFPLSTGGSRTITLHVTTDGRGSFTTRFAIPAGAASTNVTITARSASGSASTRVFVRKPVPAPTSTPIPTLAPTSTPVPAATQVPHHGNNRLYFRYVSLWYHTVRLGTYDHLDVQGNPKTTLGIWVHIYFPNGSHLDYYQNTNSHGRWQKTFTIPGNALGANNNSVFVTFRLWHGGKSVKEFLRFSLVR